MFTTIWSVIKGLSLGPTVGGWIMSAVAAIRGNWRKIMRYWYLIIIGGLAIALLWVWADKNGEIAFLESELNKKSVLMQSYEDTLKDNESALMECVAVNTANAAAYFDQIERAEEAEAEVLRLSQQSTEQIEGINDEASELRGRDEDCRRLDDPLPDWYDEWLRQ